MNALSAAVRQGLFEGFKAAIADPAAKAIVLICEGRTFIAGADITEFVDNFKLPDEELIAGNLEANKIFSDFEDLSVHFAIGLVRHALGFNVQGLYVQPFGVVSLCFAGFV